MTEEVLNVDQYLDKFMNLKAVSDLFKFKLKRDIKEIREKDSISHAVSKSKEYLKRLTDGREAFVAFRAEYKRVQGHTKVVTNEQLTTLDMFIRNVVSTDYSYALIHLEYLDLTARKDSISDKEGYKETKENVIESLSDCFYKLSIEDSGDFIDNCKEI